MRISRNTLADGREILYYDDQPSPPARVVSDSRDLPAQAPNSQIRYDPLAGEWIAIAAHRQARTYKPPADLCPLCASTVDRPTEIPEADYDVAVFENRFPSLATDIADSAATATVDLVPAKPGRGRCEVVCFTSSHDSSFAALSQRRARTVVDAWAHRTEEIGQLPDVEQIYPFENRGEAIGVTLAHPHGQIYGYPFVPLRTQRLLALSAAHHERTGRALLADVLQQEQAAGDRVVVRGEHWTAFVPAAARWPVQLQLVPHRQVPDLPALGDAERDDFARVYLDVLGRLDRLYGVPLPYVSGWHQAPVRYAREHAWLYLELFSVQRTADKLKYLAGSESGMGVWINDVTPEQIAERLRAAG